VTFLGPTGVLPTSRLPALVIRGRRNARWCFRKHPVLWRTQVALYLLFFSAGIFTFLPLLSCLFPKYMQTVAKRRHLAKCAMNWETREATVRRSRLGGHLAAPAPQTVAGPGFPPGAWFFLANLNVVIPHQPAKRLRNSWGEPAASAAPVPCKFSNKPFLVLKQEPGFSPSTLWGGCSRQLDSPCSYRPLLPSSSYA